MKRGCVVTIRPSVICNSGSTSLSCTYPTPGTQQLFVLSVKDHYTQSWPRRLFWIFDFFLCSFGSDLEDL